MKKIVYLLIKYLYYLKRFPIFVSHLNDIYSGLVGRLRVNVPLINVWIMVFFIAQSLSVEVNIDISMHILTI